MTSRDWAFFATIVGLFLVVIFGLWNETARDRELYAHCVSDGHKDYECEGMLRGRQ